MIENSMHPTMDDDELPQEMFDFLIKSMLTKLERLGQQLPNSKPVLLDCVLQIKNLADFYLYNLETYYNHFICLAESLLVVWRQDEELFLSGVGMLESFISNTDVLLNKEQYEQIVLLLQSYVFPFMATVTPEYQSMVLSAEDNETVDDSNEAHYIVKICLNSAFNWQYQRMKEAYLQFISGQPPSIGLYHFEVMMVDAMAITELVPDNFDYDIVVQSVLQLI